MKIELRGLVTHARASEETNAFDATLYVDGVKVGVVGNSGKGEGNYPRVNDPAVLEKMEAYCKSLPPLKSQYGDLEMSLDLYIGLMVEKALVRKRVQRLMKDRVLILGADGTSVLQTRKLSAEQMAVAIANPSKVCKAGERILTAEEAVEAMLSQFAAGADQ